MFDDKRILILTASPQLHIAVKMALSEFCHTQQVSAESPPYNIEELAQLLSVRSIQGIVVEASLIVGERTVLSGIELALSLRKNHRYNGFFIFLGLMSRKDIADQFVLLGPNVQGVDYLIMPVEAAEICESVRRGKELSEAGLKQVVKQYCQLEKDIKYILHKVSNLFVSKLTGKLIEDEVLAHILSVREEVKRLYDILNWLDLKRGTQILDNLLRVLSTPSSLSDDNAKYLLKELEQGESTIFSAPPFGNVTQVQDLSAGAIRPKEKNRIRIHLKQFSKANTDSAPSGYETLLVADDEGYPAESISYLEQLNYQVEVVTEMADAELNIIADPRAVFLCDQTFGTDSTAGKRLMALARQEGSWKLIVALSGSSLDASEVPEADRVCSGVQAKMVTGARRLHEIICEWATLHP